MDKIKELQKKLWGITWPIFVETLLFSLLGSVDTFMLGKYNDNAVAAVGISNQLISMLTLMFGIITVGTSILVSQYLGAKSDEKDILRLCSVAIGVNAILGIILSGVMGLFGTVFLNMLNTPQELMGLANQYIKIVGGFIFIQAIAMTFTAILRAHGLTKICMRVTLIMNIIHIVINYSLIFGKFGAPQLGVEGAAISTTLSKFLGFMILGITLYKVRFKNFKFSILTPFPKVHLRNILTIGVPSAGEQISYNLSQLVITSFINMISINSMTTKGYISNIVCFSFIFSVAIGQGNSILIGRLVGKGDNDSAYALCLSCLKKAMIVTITMSSIFVISGGTLLRLFTNNSEVITLGVSILLVDLILEPGRTINLVGINALRAAGDVKFPVCIGIFSMWTFGVGIAYFIGIKLGFGLVGVWIAFALDEWFRAILVLRRWKKKQWQGKAFV